MKLEKGARMFRAKDGSSVVFLKPYREYYTPGDIAIAGPGEAFRVASLKMYQGAYTEDHVSASYECKDDVTREQALAGDISAIKRWWVELNEGLLTLDGDQIFEEGEVPEEIDCNSTPRVIRKLQHAFVMPGEGHLVTVVNALNGANQPVPFEIYICRTGGQIEKLEMTGMGAFSLRDGGTVGVNTAGGALKIPPPPPYGLGADGATWAPRHGDSLGSTIELTKLDVRASIKELVIDGENLLETIGA